MGLAGGDREVSQRKLDRAWAIEGRQDLEGQKVRGRGLRMRLIGQKRMANQLEWRLVGK